MFGMFARRFFGLGLGVAIAFAACVNAAAAPAATDKPDTWVEVASPHFTVLCNDGEKTARRIAEQFEQIRVLYSNALSQNLRLDPGLPIEIIAVRNEKSLSEIIPEYWAQKGHAHPSGLFLPGVERNYIAIHADVEGELPYVAVYHEYVHLIENLNFRHIPLWLDEGYATFLGSATLLPKSGRLGQVNQVELAVLKQTKLLPLDVLFRVGHDSPYYNEENKTNIFYAESWALVHYLMLDARRGKGTQLGKYISLTENGGDPVDSAKSAFGDLNQLQKELDSYATRTVYSMYVIDLPEPAVPSALPSRIVSPAEVDAMLGAFDLSRSQIDSGRAKIEQALKLDPNLAIAQESMGLLLFRERKGQEAQKYFSRAVALDSKNALAYYYDGMLLVSGLSEEEDPDEAQTALEKAVALKPELAPAWDALASLYVHDPATLDKALDASEHAVKFMPGEPRYRFNLAIVMSRMGRFDEARGVAQGLAKSDNQSVVSRATKLLELIDLERQAKSSSENSTNDSARPQALGNSGGAEPSGSGRGAPVLKRRAMDASSPATNPLSDDEKNSIDRGEAPGVATASREYSMIGSIVAATCATAPQMTLTLESGRFVMHLHAADLTKIEIKSGTGNARSTRPTCSQFKGRQARIRYRLVTKEAWDGEILSVEFRD